MAEQYSRIRDKAHEFLSHYERMNSIFSSKFGYNLYFIGGTLLGYIRENDFLAHDKDMDVSYFSKYDKVVDVRLELIDIVNYLIDSGEDIYFVRSDYNIVKNYFRWSFDTRDRIDVMPSWSQEGMIYRPTFVGYKGSRDIILPLKKNKFYGHDVYIPNMPEEKLANVYGDDWRIPNLGFKKGTRKNEYTNLVVSSQLCYAKSQWALIKKTRQWQSFPLWEKLFIVMIYLRKYRIVAKVIPESKKFRTDFFRNARKFLTGK